LDKREFLTGVLAASAVALAPRGAAARVLPGAHSRTRGIDCVLYDARYSDACEFARTLAARGATPLATGQDIVPLWYGRLKARGRPQRLAGLTPHSDLVLLAECARELDLALLYQGMHDCRGAGAVTHCLRARGGFADAAAAAVFGAAQRWPVALAAALEAAALRGVWAPALKARASAPRAADHPGTLSSFVIGAV